MATLTLTFTLPEEAVEARQAQNGWRYQAVLWDVDQECRSAIKYQDELPEGARAAYEQVRQWIGNYCQDRGISLDDE